jgi:hypothetical protein
VDIRTSGLFLSIAESIDRGWAAFTFVGAIRGGRLSRRISNIEQGMSKVEGQGIIL